MLYFKSSDFSTLHKEMRSCKNADTFWAGFQTKLVFPKELIDEVNAAGWSVDPSSIGGIMDGAVEPHDDAGAGDSDQHHSLVWFPNYPRLKYTTLHLFASGKWHFLSRGDAVIIKTDLVHAVIPKENRRWAYVATFVTRTI